MARYLWNEKTHKLELLGDGFTDPNKGLNGPVWHPGHPYFDKALNRTFNTLSDKKEFMRQHGLAMEGSSKEYKGVEAKGIGSTYYSIPGVRPNRTYKHR
jgi:hypothetical protein